MAKSVSILSLVGNALQGSVGPGHSAISVDHTVFSFEVTAGWADARSGWRIIGRSEYLNLNRSRPVIVQDLKSGQVNADHVLRYLLASDSNDDDYIGSGVCSSQVSNAIDAGTTVRFDPFGLDHPATVFHLARKLGLVQRTTVIPPTNWTWRSKMLLRDLYRLEPDGSASPLVPRRLYHPGKI